MRELREEELDAEVGYGQNRVQEKRVYDVEDIRCPPGYRLVKEYDKKSGVHIRNYCRKRPTPKRVWI